MDWIDGVRGVLEMLRIALYMQGKMEKEKEDKRGISI